MVAVAAVSIHIQGHCAVISQSTAGNTHPPGNLMTFMVVRAMMTEIQCSILVILDTLHYLIDTVVPSHRNIVTLLSRLVFINIYSDFPPSHYSALCHTGVNACLCVGDYVEI